MPKRLQHLLLATTEDAYNIKAWSGIPSSLRTALERQVERVSVFRPSPPSRTPWDTLKRLLFGAKKYPLWITKATLRKNARELRAEIARLQPDAVLSISSQTVAFLGNSGVPVFLFSDAPYLAFCEAYARWENYPLRIDAFGSEEANAARALDGLFFGSAWACDEAARLYGFRGSQISRLHATPLGANWTPGLSREEIFDRIDSRSFEQIHLLYVGRDWERKGGPLAVEVTRLLRAAGANAHLHIVGCRPDLGEDAGPNGFATVHGLLYQNDPVQSATLAELFLGSHFLLVPTLAECFGIVFAEAQAFGLPPISRRVHALPSVILDVEGGATSNTQTGLLFPADASAEDYVLRIKELLSDPHRYRAMARRARIRFEEVLNWDSTAASMVAAVTDCLEREA